MRAKQSNLPPPSSLQAVENSKTIQLLQVLQTYIFNTVISPFRHCETQSAAAIQKNKKINQTIQKNPNTKKYKLSTPNFNLFHVFLIVIFKSLSSVRSSFLAKCPDGGGGGDSNYNSLKNTLKNQNFECTAEEFNLDKHKDIMHVNE
ncbi:MAG: hypothetical protein LBP54_06525, partial [Campylobacteraceae bacterium]|nr:hypothetical protein [Campylobacteraceae bacterium]